jgi:cytochrome P450
MPTQALGESTEPDLDDLLSELAINDPDEYFRLLREDQPVRWNERWHGWIVTGFDEVTSGFRDHRRLSSDRFRGPFARDINQSGTRYRELIDFMSMWMFSNDRPYHTHLRSLVNAAFTPRSVDQLRPRIRELVRELAEPLRDGQDVDFMSQFAFQLPVIVIAEYLGIPAGARSEVRQLSEDLGALIFVQGSSEDRFANGEKAKDGLVDIIRPVVRSRTAEPRDDLISAMVHVDIDGDSFTEEEVISNAVLMVFAGHETTMNLLANGIVAFNRFPDEWDRLQSDPQGLSRTATEEILRLDGPIKANARWAREPLQLGGKDIQVADRVLLVQHAANHDPAAFAEPDRLDITRWPNKHVAFGSGIHTCLGAPLSRLEAQEAFAYLAEAFSSIEVTTPEVRYVPNLVSHGPAELHTRFHPA